MSAVVGKGLGKGLGALLQNVDMVSEGIKASIVELKINDISPNADQPRKWRHSTDYRLQGLAGLQDCSW
jgi:hypothetical protein